MPDGSYVVMISGYMTTSDSFFKNSSDAIASLQNLSGGGSHNSTVDSVIAYIAMNLYGQTYRVEGHSLGALDATVLAREGFGGSGVTLYSPPLPIPSGALLGNSAMPIVAYCGLHDPICATSIATWTLSGVNVKAVDTGIWLDVHDRTLYQQLAGKPESMRW
jgi:hypothetical protein